jgi:23S rRNA pseudouridine2457 synthase
MMVIPGPHESSDADDISSSPPPRTAPASVITRARTGSRPSTAVASVPTFGLTSGPVLIAFHKPYGVISQFTPDGSPNRNLANFGLPPGVYPIGRLDADSEGLLLLSDEPDLNQRLLHPKQAHARLYWAQVENIPRPEALRRLERGLLLQGRKTLPCRASLLEPPPLLPPRVPPIRQRKSIPTAWIALELIEGKNRQVRRMTAAVGHPTLRLIRVRIGAFELGDLPVGAWRELSASDRQQVLKAKR